MKRFNELRGLWALAICVLLACILPKGEVRASEGQKNIFLDVTYHSFDITGDGKKDKVCFEGVESYERCETIRVKINKTRTILATPGAYTSGVQIRLLTLANGKPFVYLYGMGDNGDGVCGIYQYKNKKLRQIIDLNDIASAYGYHTGGSVSKVKGNKVVIRYYLMSYSLAAVEFDIPYAYKSGTLKRMGNTGTVVSYSPMYVLRQKYYTAQKRIPVYKKAGSTAKKAFTIRKNQKVYVTHVWIKNGKMWFKLRVNGQSGWMPASKKYYMDDAQKPFKEIMYAG